jgi:hypothetical protein
VTYWGQGEYRNSTDVLVPVPPLPEPVPPDAQATVAIGIGKTGNVRVIVNGEEVAN